MSQKIKSSSLSTKYSQGSTKIYADRQILQLITLIRDILLPREDKYVNLIFKTESRWEFNIKLEI